MQRRSSLRTALAFTLALPCAFAAGLAAGEPDNGFKSTVNQGLVNAFDSVGTNLFGHAAFAARVLPDPDDDTRASVQMDFVCQPPAADGSVDGIPRILNIVYPPDPVQPELGCQIGFQIVMDELGITAVLNPDVATFETFYGSPMGAAQCEVGAAGGGPSSDQ